MADEIRLVAIDMDGTLLNAQKIISIRDLNTVEQALSRKVVIGIASARDWASIRTKFPFTLPGLYFLASGGALIYDAFQEKLIWARYLDWGQVEEAVAFLKHYGHPIFLNAENTYWADRRNDRVRMVERRYTLIAHPFDALNGSDWQRIMRVSLSAPPAVLERAAADAQASLSERFTISLASPDWLDLLPLGAGKGAVLSELQTMLGIAPSATAAIGDYTCDLDLFEHARYRVAMGNAVDSLKAAATHITADNNHDGVSQCLQSWLN
jgi:Cof subfamily protein (haloacid dehalogenase superfamily)